MIFHHANPCKFRGIDEKKKNTNKPKYPLGTKWTHADQMSKMY